MLRNRHELSISGSQLTRISLFTPWEDHPSTGTGFPQDKDLPVRIKTFSALLKCYRLVFGNSIVTTIATFTVPEEAHLFRTFLESRGIEGFVLDENMVQLFWHYSNAIGGVRLAVDDDDAEDALTSYHEYMEALNAGPYPERPVRVWPAVALLSLIVGVPFLIFGRRDDKSRAPAD